MESPEARNDKYEWLKLKNQLCFPLYACSKEIIKKYRPFLDEIGLTYTQYIAMMVLWETNRISAKDMGDRLFLDSGTLTPVLKSLAVKGLITRERSKDDERVLMLELTEEGSALREKACEVPVKVAKCVCLSRDETMELYGLLYKLLNG
ncbi:MAG: MarR family transcriptional regulator [Clostridia bacterium]|nr:MarR family transcriptional regulator [Clostridia bacterium]